MHPTRTANNLQFNTFLLSLWCILQSNINLSCYNFPEFQAVKHPAIQLNYKGRNNLRPIIFYSKVNLAPSQSDHLYWPQQDYSIFHRKKAWLNA